MMKTLCKIDLGLEMALESMRIVCVHESQTKNNWTQTCMCIELRSDKHITLTTQQGPVSYKLMPETIRFPQSKISGYCCTRSRDLLASAISSSICGTRISSICFKFQVHTAYTTSTSSRSIICSHVSSAMDSLHELFPRIRITRIRTALNGRLNEGFPVCSRR